MPWNRGFTPPAIVTARVLARLPDALRLPAAGDWARANKPGQVIECFLEGPAFDRAGNLWLTDIPSGRLLRLSPEGAWDVAAFTDGWPNGIAIHRDGALWVADYRRGLLRVDPSTGGVETVLGHRNSEAFRGLNDLTFGPDGALYFTDQGQTGLHDASGRVYRLAADGSRLDLLLATVPSPNGVALAAGGRFLFVAATRANAVWRMPLLADGSVAKAGAFQTFFGASGPDGLAFDAEGRLVVCHASLGGAFVLDADGWCTHFVQSPIGGTVTNCAFRPGTRTLVLTESASGTVLEAELPAPGAPLFSHA